jgi:hypothetical protein
MTSLAQVAVNGVPHHVTQRGHWRQLTFVKQEDQAAYPTDKVHVTRNPCGSCCRREVGYKTETFVVQ